MFSFLLDRFRKKSASPASSETSSHLTLGRRGEELARQFLEQEGYRILVCNYRVRLGEIDLIAEEGDTLVFVEVKARAGSTHGHPLEAITPAKQRQLAKVALHYLSGSSQERPVRFDVISVLLDRGGPPRLELTRDAFELPAGM